MGNEPAITLSKKDIEQLIAAHDGDMALLYLHSRLYGGDREQAARDLCMTARAVSEAEEKLLRMGISLDGETCSPKTAVKPSRSSSEKILPSDEFPDYTSDDIATCSEQDEAFHSVIEEAQRILGKQLSSNDLKILFGFYDHLGLPAEVIMLLINYVVQSYEEKNGEGRRPVFRTIQKEAYRWANMGIITLDEADAYISHQRERGTERMKAAELLEIRGRKLTESETKWLDSWLDMGFELDVFREAYDRTVTNTGKMAWKYMDTIMTNWHSKGIHTVADINEKDRPASKKKSPKAASADISATAMNENIEKLMNMVREKEGDKS